MERILAAFGRLLQLASREPPPLGSGLGVHPDQVGPQPSRFRPQRLTLRTLRCGETAQGKVGVWWNPLLATLPDRQETGKG